MGGPGALTTNDRESLGYLTQDVHAAWEEMTAAIRVGDRATYEAARQRFFEGEGKAHALLEEFESAR